LFFTYTGLSTPDGFFWMGVMAVGATALYMLMYFPMWGGMFAKAKEGVTEEDYYLAEWTPEERAQVRLQALPAEAIRASTKPWLSIRASCSLSVPTGRCTLCSDAD
jgi:hypothetical protein